MLLVERNFAKPVRILEAMGAQLPDGVLLQLIYPVCNIGELNANKRMYERELWDLVLENQDLQEKLSNRNLYGQAEHPKETASDLQLTSHIIHEMWIGEDSKVYQTFDVLDTPCGRIIECLVRAGSKVGVSTRAEGDLEETMNEETGEKYHRVVPKSYRYVTTDFTADPSTFGAMAVDVKKNIITAARAAAESKSSKVGEVRFARGILESLECDHKHTCQKCGACKCRKGEGSDMKSTVAEAIKSGKLTEGKVVSLTVKTKIGETKYTHASVKKIYEGKMDILVNGASLIVDGSSAVTIRPDGNVDIFPSDSGPVLASAGISGEDALAAAMGAEREGGPAPEAAESEEEAHKTHEETETPEKEKMEHKDQMRKMKGVPESKTKKIKSYKKNEAKLTEKVEGLKSLVICPFEKEEGGLAYRICGVFEGEPEPITLVNLDNKSEAMKVGKNLAVLTKVPFEDENEQEPVAFPEDSEEAEELESQWSNPSPKGIPNESKVNEHCGFCTGSPEDNARLLGVTLRVQQEKKVDLEGAIPIVARLIDKSPEETRKLIDDAINSGAAQEDPYTSRAGVYNNPEELQNESKIHEGRNKVLIQKIRSILDGFGFEIVGRIRATYPGQSFSRHMLFTIHRKDSKPFNNDERRKVYQALIDSEITIAGGLPDSRSESDNNYDDIMVILRDDKENSPAYESKISPLEAFNDLRIKEACMRAERDTLLEGRDAQLRVVLARLKESASEITGLRALLEKKTSALKESTKPNKNVEKLNENIKTQHAAHQQELVETANKSKSDGRNEVLKDYFDSRLSACRLEADDNTQALLERCKGLDDVDQLIENLVRVAQRGALHPSSLKDVVVRERKTDPEQDKIDGQIGGLMKSWSA